MRAGARPYGRSGCPRRGMKSWCGSLRVCLPRGRAPRTFRPFARATRCPQRRRIRRVAWRECTMRVNQQNESTHVVRREAELPCQRRSMRPSWRNHVVRFSAAAVRPKRLHCAALGRKVGTSARTCCRVAGDDFGGEGRCTSIRRPIRCCGAGDAGSERRLRCQREEDSMRLLDNFARQHDADHPHGMGRESSGVGIVRRRARGDR